MYRNAQQMNQALALTGSQYRVPTQDELGAQNQQRGMKLAGTLLDAYTGNFAGAAQGLKSAQQSASPQQGQPAGTSQPGKGFDVMGLFGKLFGG